MFIHLVFPFLSSLVLSKRVGEGKGHCTALGIAPEATEDNTAYASQTDDGEGLGDYRLIFVPGKKHAKGSKRAVYADGDGATRLVAPELSPEYGPTEDQPKPSVPLGYIPQVEETYAYWDGDYALQNEWLSIGESTCSSRLYAWPLGSPNGKGTAMFSVEELSRVALERCKTATCAIDTMGALAEQYGYWSTQDVSDSGEALTLADAKETWVFHILPDPTGKSAIWAAQRVPPGHLVVVANMFIIRVIDFDDHDNFKWSTDMVNTAVNLGWWHPTAEDPDFDFTAIFSSGEYGHPYYSARRAWRIMSRVAPSLELDGDIGYEKDRATYPFSVAPEWKLSILDIFDLYRDHYEGTKYDLTSGLSAGPFHNPSRWPGMVQPKAWQGPEPDRKIEGKHGVAIDTAKVPNLKYGAWERSISIYRTTYCHIAGSRLDPKTGEQKNVLWWGPGRSSATVFTPLRIKGATEAPLSLRRGSQNKVDPQSLWWATTAVANWADLRYDEIHQDMIKPFQSKIETAALAFVKDEKFWTANEKVLSDYIQEIQSKVWDLFMTMMVVYQNGYVIKNGQANESGYPTDWIEAMGDYTHFQSAPEKFDEMTNTMKVYQKVADQIAGTQEPKSERELHLTEEPKEHVDESVLIV